MKKNIVYLEGLRGVAALTVVIAHFFQVFLPATLKLNTGSEHTQVETWIRDNPLNLIYNGNFAVCLFFILSGYVLSFRFFQSGDPQAVTKLAIKRYPRLAIPALVSVLIGFGLMKFDLSYYSEIKDLTLSTMKDPFKGNLTFDTAIVSGLIFYFFQYKGVLNPVLWTMTYEFFGSFLIFSFLLIFGKTKMRYIVYAVLILFFLESFYLAFVLGMLLSDLKNNEKNVLLYMFNQPFIRIVILLLGIYFGSFPYVETQNPLYLHLKLFGPTFPYFMFYHIIGGMFLFLAVLHSERLKKFLSNSFCSYIGKISFSLYLIHFSVLLTGSCYLFSFLYPTFTYGVSFLLTIVLSIPALWLFSHLFYVLVDKKVTTWLSRLVK